jgi:glycosyltransferase involved in cell wall biosynthesis
MAALISIAVCTYNSGNFLIPMLDSLLRQDWRPIEIVCVDDASTDETFNTLARYQLEHPHIFRIERNEVNLGYIKNFEKCLSLCKGEWIAIGDHDDIWEPEKLTVLKSALGDALMVYSNSTLIDEAGKELGEKLTDSFNLIDQPPAAAFAFYDFIWGHTALIKKTLLEKALPIPENMPYDTWLGFTAASVSSIRFVDQPLTKWRRHPKAYSTTMFEENKTKKAGLNWKYEEYLQKKQRLKQLSENKYGERVFMSKLHQYYCELQIKFSWNLFFFLINNNTKLFPIWRRNYISRINEFRKMSRKVPRY